jgi:hypothetical protein
VQDITKQLSNIKRVLLTEFKVGKILQKKLVTKFYNLKEDLQRYIPKKN